jgi:HAD superfamily hydrolase (TIGR01490 family)
MRAAVFDVDRTLLDGMSGYLFARHLMRTGAMPLAGRWRSYKAVALYRLGLADMMIIVAAGATCVAGLTAARVEQLAAAAVAEAMRPRFFAEGLAAIAAHRRRGDLVLLATGSNSFVARALAHEVGADDAVGTDCERDGERLLPRMARPACVADGKKQLVLAWLAGRGVAPAEATVYTDNGIDLPLLEVVGEPVAVNADAELAAEAARRGWRAESWTTTRDAARPRSGESWPLRR